jgi:hypothetical protein
MNQNEAIIRGTVIKGLIVVSAISVVYLAAYAYRKNKFSQGLIKWGIAALILIFIYLKLFFKYGTAPSLWEELTNKNPVQQTPEK